MSSEDKETEKALVEFARSVREIKRKEWDQYKNVFPQLYKEYVGPTPVHIEIDKMQETIENLTYDNKSLKEEIKDLKKTIKKKDKEIEKKDKEIEKIRSSKKIDKNTIKTEIKRLTNQ